MELHPRTLDRLDARIRVPSYDRGALARSIVHIGVGGFHRAHLATYIDELALAGHTDWGIVGVGVLENDAAMAQALAAQDGLYTLVARDERGAEVEVIGSLLAYVHAFPKLDELIELVAAPQTRIVSLTVTEGGYPVDDETGDYDAASPNAGPTGAFAAIARGLRRRRDSGLGGLTVLSCDNVMGNGHVTRAATLGVADDLEPDVVGWIAEHVSFPSSMVDRITPATTDRDRAWLAEGYGLEDRWPVVAEPFRQWVVEDRFADARPPLDELDVIVTGDVEPYELFKLRLLNASHSCLAYLAHVLEIELVDEVMAEGRFAEFVRRFLVEEAGPTVPRAPGIDLARYQATLIDRFSNPATGDQVQRLCLDGSVKFPKFLLPTVRAQLDAGGPIRLAALALAGWCTYLVGRAESGRELTLSPDPNLDRARDYARRSEDDPRAFLAFRSVFGDDLPGDERFVDSFTSALRRVRTVGVRAAMDEALAE